MRLTKQTNTNFLSPVVVRSVPAQPSHPRSLRDVIIALNALGLEQFRVTDFAFGVEQAEEKQPAAVDHRGNFRGNF